MTDAPRSAPGRAPVSVQLDGAPALGPYCPITGRRLRPWWSSILWAAFHALSLVAIFVGANHLHTHLYGAGEAGRTAAVLLWSGVAAAVYVAGWFVARLGFAARLLLTAGAVWAVVVAWREQAPLSFADPELEWTRALDAERLSWDTFLAEAGAPPALVLFALVYAACALVVTYQTLRAVVRSWNLPRRSWFVRYHPVWRRRYAPDESAHPLAGVLWVRDDELLTDKLVWLVSDRRDAAFRLAPPLAAGDPPAIPLGALDGPVTLWREREHWYRSGELPREAAVVRLVFGDALPHGGEDGEATPPPLVVPADPAGLPVRDLFAEDEGCVAKRYDAQGAAGELFGLLLDGRPARHENGSFTDVPHFTALVREGGRLRAERPHPDLLGEPYEEDGRALLPWRGETGEPLTLELDARADAVHWIAQEGGGYHLLFLAFGDGANGTASGGTRP